MSGQKTFTLTLGGRSLKMRRRRPTESSCTPTWTCWCTTSFPDQSPDVQRRNGSGDDSRVQRTTRERSLRGYSLFGYVRCLTKSRCKLDTEVSGRYTSVEWEFLGSRLPMRSDDPEKGSITGRVGVGCPRVCPPLGGWIDRGVVL